MASHKSIPFPDCHASAEAYIESLLSFVTSSTLLQTLCGGVHILDFFIQKPDLYSSILDLEWREWIDVTPISNLLDLLMRENIENLLAKISKSVPGETEQNDSPTWRDGLFPPLSLLQYIQKVQQHLLLRNFDSTHAPRPVSLTRQVSAGMNLKKAHEVERFAAFLSTLTDNLSKDTPAPITHLVDFGSGQNYLGRALASPPYNKHVIALESKKHNIEGAKAMDVGANLAQKKLVMRNKKAFRNAFYGDSFLIKASSVENEMPNAAASGARDQRTPVSEEASDKPQTQKIQYLEHVIRDGNLQDVTCKFQNNREPSLMVVSLHSCGNLVHHGLRSLLLNHAVRAVAMVGCCYNLMTERLGPTTWKLPTLRPDHPRLDKTRSVFDPHGFPMSKRLEKYKHNGMQGIQFNITARMMAVQAPQNWDKQTSEGFFTRHYYRALLQRIFHDRGLLRPVMDCSKVVNDTQMSSTCTQPIIIGSLRKACYTSFVAYVRGAVAKLSSDNDTYSDIRRSIGAMSDREIEGYDVTYRPRKKQLSAVWSLMAFNAGIVESSIVVDRWCFLKEQEGVADAWVETVFEYQWSPRNLVVVGIKKLKENDGLG